MMKLTTKITNLTKKQQRTVVKETVLWCQGFFGVNNRRKEAFTFKVTPQPKRHFKKHGKIHGQFDEIENVLVVYPENNPDVRELIKTTIHEYTHYLQPIRSKYHDYNEWFSYDDNPLEVQARLNEKLYRNCWKSIKKIIL